MIQIFKMALRNLGRNRRRSFFSALALALGLALLLLMASTVRGEMNGSLDLSIKLQSGHIQVQSKSYSENKTSLAWEDLLEDPQQMAAKIATLESVKAATPRLFASGIVTKSDESTGVRIIGIDPASPANDPYRLGMVTGDYLQADDREGILIGQPLAEELGLKPGDKVNLLVNTSNGDVDEQPFTVRGIYTTHTPGLDKVNIFMPLAKTQTITQANNHASIIFVLLNNRDQTNNVVSALKTSRYQIETWEKVNELLKPIEDYSQSFMVLLYIIVLGITATVIVNTLVMAVFERTREIGILAAIGMRRSRIMALFLAESSLLAIAGIILGLLLGGILVAYASTVGFYIGDYGTSGAFLLGDRIYASFSLGDTINLTLAALVITLLGAMYPAILAARLEPVQALHGH